MTPQVPVLKDIVLVGAGHAHVTVLRRFGMKPMPGVRLTLITQQVHTPYSGMLPGLIAGLYDYDQAHIDTGPLSRFAQARLYQAEAIGLDLENRRVICRDRPPVPYDVLSIDIGSRPSAHDVPGVAEHAVPVKPIDGFLDKFEAARARILAAKGRARVGVVGAGAGGVELMLAFHRRLMHDVAAAGLDPSQLAFTLFSASDVLPGFPTEMRSRFSAIFQERGIAVVTNGRVRAVEPGAVDVENHGRVAIDEVFWTTEAEPARWLARTGLALDDKGFIRVAPTLQSVSHPEVFAAGDVAAIDGYSVPRSGVYAVREGRPLDDNIRRLISGRPLVLYKPQRNALYLISTGERYAIGTRNGITLGGSWVWTLKDWIDRRFMAKFNALPDMKPAEPDFATAVADKRALDEISSLTMRCGGCGAKIGATLLSRVLGTIVPAARDDVVLGLDAPDDAAVIDAGGERLLVQTVDYFRDFIDDPYLFGKIAANHALGDVHAMGGEPQTALAIATLPYGLEDKIGADLSMMMTGANEILREADCSLVGGHTSEGAEMALGFAVTGLVPRGAALCKSGLRPGDVLILTKPLGTGALFAAHMRGKAKARWIMTALAHMTLSNRNAAAVLREQGATAATDVTGFGLLGHLVEMVKASNVDATIVLPRIPLLDGLREVLDQQIHSSLQPQNVRLRRAIRNLDEVAEHPLYPVLFDPQTAGGLLASVPPARVTACIAALNAAGYPDAVAIGSVRHRSEASEPITIETIERSSPSDERMLQQA